MSRNAFRVLACLLVLGLVMAAGQTQASDQVVGSLKNVKGTAQVIRGKQTLAAKQGLKLMQQDTLTTGKDGSLGVIFRDDSVLSLGPESELVIDEFVFQPAEGKMSMITNMVKGTASYLTGKIGKAAPDKVKMETPLATIGIRGTHYLVKVDPDLPRKKIAKKE
jgi:hypothetical protein